MTPPSAGAVVPEARSLERERSDPAIAQPARKRRHPRRNRGRWTPPWVAVQSLVPPSVEAAEIFKEEIPEEPQVPWHVFDGSAVGALRVDFENAPPYVKNGQRPLFYIEPREDSRYARAFQRVVRRKLFSELRSEAKRTWREVFASRPRMSFADFEKRLLQINRLGREKGEGSLFDQDYYTTALKEDLFAESYREGESDIPIVAWGPFVVTDTGSMRVDLGRLVEFEEFVTDPENVEIQPGESEKRPFLQSRDYRVHTNVRLHFDPLAPVDEADPTWLIKRYGVAVTVDWLSDVLGKEMLSAELEAEVDRDGDFGVAINFIIRSRD